MISVPVPPTAIERALAQVYREEVTGLVTASLTLTNAVAQTLDGKSLLLLFKNGAALSEGAGAAKYTVTGSTVTLGTAAIAGDAFVAWYYYRT